MHLSRIIILINFIWSEGMIINETDRRLNNRCHYDNFKKATVCVKKDGSLWEGPAGGRDESTSVVIKTPKPPISYCPENEEDRFHSEKWIPKPTKKFYIYDGGVYDYLPLVTCYREKFKVDVWRDERMWELAQNSGALWVHEALKKHRLRTLDPSEAEFFFIPIDGWLSQKSAVCAGTTHEQRINRIYTQLNKEESFINKPNQHVLVSLWWGTTKSIGKRFSNLLQPSTTIVAFDEYFASEWTKVVVAPYVPHAMLTSSSMEAEVMCLERRKRRLSITAENIHNIYLTDPDAIDATIPDIITPPIPRVSSSVYHQANQPSDQANQLNYQTKSSSLSTSDTTTQLQSDEEKETARQEDVKKVSYADAAEVIASSTPTVKSTGMVSNFINNMGEAVKSTLLKHGDKGPTLERDISVYFRGSVMHGVMCKKHGTWPRREAFFALQKVQGGVFIPTESPHISEMWEGGGVPEICKHFYKKGSPPDLRICSRAFQGRFTTQQYVDELRRSKWCLHFRGDTTTARRFFDSIAAGCVPIIVSDGVNLPFIDRLNWKDFSVQISEKDMVSGRDQVISVLSKLANDKALLLKKQKALIEAYPHLIFGFGSPMNGSDHSKSHFQSYVVDHILEEVVRASKKDGLYRRFPVTMAACDYKRGAEIEEKARKNAIMNVESHAIKTVEEESEIMERNEAQENNSKEVDEVKSDVKPSAYVYKPWLEGTSTKKKKMGKKKKMAEAAQAH